jgi:hypothetical protein
MATMPFACCVRAAAVAALLVGSVMAGGTARAEAPEERDAVVVDVAPPGALDAYRLRAAIGIELGVDAIASDAPRAAQARGKLEVRVDAQTHHLTVSYQARNDPVARTVDLPGDPEAAQKAAVVLAGNLGRDEASELAAALRHEPTRPSSEPNGPAVPGTTPPRSVPGTTPSVVDEDEPDSDRFDQELRDALDYYAEQAHKKRVIGLWTSITLGVFTSGIVASAPWIATSAPSSNSIEIAGAVGGALGAIIVAEGLAITIDSTPIEKLDEYYRKGGSAKTTTETWVRYAANEHSYRRAAGVIGTIIGGLEFALGVYTAADRSSFASLGGPRTSSDDAVLSAFCLGAGSLFMVRGLENVTSDGPTETSLHAFEHGHGIPAWGLASHLALGPTPGGASATLHFTF